MLILIPTLLKFEFYLHLQTFFVIFSSYIFQMKQISTLLQLHQTKQAIPLPGPNSAQKWVQIRKFRKLMSQQESASSRYHLCQFSFKLNNFEFFSSKLPKKWIQGWKLRQVMSVQESTSSRSSVCANSLAKRATLTFSTQICPKMDLGLEIHKTNVAIRISILEIPCVPIFRQNGQL